MNILSSTRKAIDSKLVNYVLEYDGSYYDIGVQYNQGQPKEITITAVYEGWSETFVWNPSDPILAGWLADLGLEQALLMAAIQAIDEADLRGVATDS